MRLFMTLLRAPISVRAAVPLLFLLLTLSGIPLVPGLALAEPPASPAGAGAGIFDSLPLPAGITPSGSYVAGSDGATWFLAVSGSSTVLGRLDSSGVFTSYPFPAKALPQGSLLAASDGGLWIEVVYQGAGDLTTNTQYFARFTTAGAYTQFALPAGNVALGPVSNGPDGGLWFQLEYISQGPTIVNAEMTMPGAYLEFGSGWPLLWGKGVIGPDGGFWVQYHDVSAAQPAGIGRLSSPGGGMTFHALPAGTNVTDLALGPDGAFWLTVNTYDPNIGVVYAIGHMTTAGVYNSFPLPAGAGTPSAIISGTDNVMWIQAGPGSVFATTGPQAATATDPSLIRMQSNGATDSFYMPSILTPTGSGGLILSRNMRMGFGATDSSSNPVIGRFKPPCATSSAADLCFRPNPNGYAFPNFRGGLAADFTLADLRQLLGDSTVCITHQGQCIPKPMALKDLELLRSFAANGECAGLALSSLIYYLGQASPASLQPGANNAHDLSLANARRAIMSAFVRQYYDPVFSARRLARGGTPNDALATLRTELQSSDPPELSIFADSALKSGHSVTPYAIDDLPNGVSHVRIYDSNYPDDTSRFVTFNTQANTWSYPIFSGTTWSGSAASHSIGAVALSLYYQPLVPGFQPSAGAAPALTGSTSKSILEGGGHLLITDAQGRRLGFTGATPVNEIPGGGVNPVVGGLGSTHEPIYTYPPTSTVSIVLAGQTVTQTQPISLYQSGPGYAAALSGILLGPTDQHQLSVLAGGGGLIFSPTSAGQPALSLIQAGANIETEFRITGAAVGAGQTISLTYDAGTGRLAFSNAQAGGGTFALTITRVSDSAGLENYVHAAIPIGAGDTDYFNVGAWSGRNALNMDIDHGSNGSMDQTVSLDNQERYLFLPFILR